jgi:hypothetical protein
MLLNAPEGELMCILPHQRLNQNHNHIRVKKIKVSSLVPTEMKMRMDRYPKINWSQIMRDAIEKELQVLEGLNRCQGVEIASPSK